MAVTITKVTAMSNGADFLKKMTPSTEVKVLIGALEAGGVSFATHFYFFLATPKGGEPIQTVLPVGCNTLADAHSNKKGFTPEMAVAESKLRDALYDLGKKVLGEEGTNKILFGKPKITAEEKSAWLKIVPTAGLPAPSQPMKFLTPPGEAQVKPKTKTGLKPGSFVGAGDEIDFALPDPQPAPKQTPKPGFLGGASKDIVKLIEATQPGQRVFGSSSGSIYTCIGITEPASLKLAVRYEDSQLSFRVEGTLTTGVVSTLQQHGFEMKAGYASMHLGCGNMGHARRAIGAVLFGTGIDYSRKLDKLEAIFS